MFHFYLAIGFLFFAASIFIAIIFLLEVEDNNKYWLAIIVGSWVLFFASILTDLSLYSYKEDEVKYEVELLDSGETIIVDEGRFINVNKEIGKNIEDGTIVTKIIENHYYPIAPDREEIRYTLDEND